MSALYGTIDADASRTTASRRGHRNITGHIRGWTLGVRVSGRIDGEGRETFDVYLTSGSNGGPSDVLLGNVALHGGYRWWFPAVGQDAGLAIGENAHRGEPMV